jgi:hypothetical protein
MEGCVQGCSLILRRRSRGDGNFGTSEHTWAAHHISHRHRLLNSIEHINPVFHYVKSIMLRSTRSHRSRRNKQIRLQSCRKTRWLKRCGDIGNMTWEQESQTTRVRGGNKSRRKMLCERGDSTLKDFQIFKLHKQPIRGSSR